MTNVRNWITSGDKRSILVKKNIIASFALKGISILISLQVVPLTINYVNPTQYGIWLTLSSLVAWFYFFDIGLTHGFRNRFAEAKARGDIETARIYLSTTYAALAIMFSVMFAIVTFANGFIDWSNILNIDPAYREELKRVFLIIISFFGLNIVFSTFTTMLTADQKPAASSFIQVLGQAVALAIIFTLTKLQSSGNLTTLAFVFSGVPAVVVLLSSIAVFNTRYRDMRPSFRLIRFRKVKDIMGLGVEFFIITTSMLFIFNLMNIIISRKFGPGIVTEYNIAYKYFSIIHMAVTLVLTPFWSAFTDAYTRNDFSWISRMSKRLIRLWFLTIPVLITMCLAAKYVYRLWIGDTVSVSTTMNVSVAIYILFMTFGSIHMYMINGIGKVRLQMTIYLSFAVIAYPIMSLCCEKWGISGLLIIPTIVYAAQGVLGNIQLKKIIGHTASGIWDK